MASTAKRMALVDEPRPARATARQATLPFDWSVLLTGDAKEKTELTFDAGDTIYSQGQPADSVYFLQRGKVTLAVTSPDGKEAIVATLSPGEFFGEGSLAGQPYRMSTAVSSATSTLTRVAKPLMGRLLHHEQGFAEAFVDHLLTRLTRYEADLVDQIFNSAEKRLARMLLLLSRFGPNSTSETLVAGVNQEHLAQMVGTTRSRINFFMNRFRKLRFIDYDADAGLTVHRGLLTVLRDD